MVCVRARVRFLLVRPLSNIGQNEMRSINSLWFVHSVFSRQDFFTSLKIYHLINFMTSYFSLLSSVLSSYNNNFLVVCFQIVCHSRIYIHLKARKTFPMRCSVLYVIFSRQFRCHSKKARSTKSFSQKSWFNVQAWPRQKLTLVSFSVMLSMSFHFIQCVDHPVLTLSRSIFIIIYLWQFAHSFGH